MTWRFRRLRLDGRFPSIAVWTVSSGFCVKGARHRREGRRTGDTHSSATARRTAERYPYSNSGASVPLSCPFCPSQLDSLSLLLRSSSRPFDLLPPFLHDQLRPCQPQAFRAENEYCHSPKQHISTPSRTPPKTPQTLPSITRLSANSTCFGNTDTEPPTRLTTRQKRVVGFEAEWKGVEQRYMFPGGLLRGPIF
jgi:hypothetical protein